MENEASDDVRDALKAIDAGRAAAADRLVTPLWYHPVLGVFLAGYIVAVAQKNLIVMLIAIPLFFAGIITLVTIYKKITGLWISAFRAGRASWWAAAMGIVVMALYAGQTAGIWPVWVTAVVAFLAVNVFGLLFDRTLRASLRDGSVTVPK